MAKVPTASEGEVREPGGDAGTSGPRGRTVQRAVLAALGRPPGLFSVSVRPLWGDHHRVNVLVGADALSARIAHSFFVETDATGHIHASTPRITRLYA
jgi:hypothetical protein